MDENMKIIEAAKKMGKNPEYVRAGLRSRRLPFGSAVQTKENGQWNYHISTASFWLYQYGFIPKELKKED